MAFNNVTEVTNSDAITTSDRVVAGPQPDNSTPTGEVDFSNITNLPTSAAGYGIINGDEMDSLAAVTTFGLLTRTADNTYTTRSLTAPAAGITITNPAGIAGSPTFALANDLAALEGLTGTGYGRRTGSDAWTLDATIPWASISATPTTLAGYGITDAQPLDADLTAIAALSGTGYARRTGANTWTLDTIVPVTDADYGDITVTSSGSVWTIDNNVVSNAKLRDSAANSVIGRSTNSSGDPADITAGTDAHVLRLSGTTLGFGTIGDASITGVAWSKITSTPTTLAGYGITDAQPIDADLTAIAALSGTGIAARTASNTWALRTITGTSNQVIVANGDGVGGNPALSLPQDIATTSNVQFGSLSTSGLALLGYSAAFYTERAGLYYNQDATTYFLVKNDTNGSSAFSGIVLNAFGNSWGIRMGSSSANSNDLQFDIDLVGGAPVTKGKVTSTGFQGALGATTPSTVACTTITTSAPSGSSAAAWKLGSYTADLTVTPTGRVAVDIGGTVYKFLVST